MAVNRVLTSDEKFTLQADSRFQNLCNQAVLDKALYWTQQTGINLGTEVLSSRWAKSRLRGQAIVRDPGQTNSPAQQFIIFLKNIQLWDSAITPFNTTTVCDYMLAQSTFDTLADDWMDEQIRGIDF